MRGCAVAEGIVHSRELGLNVVLTEANHFKRLYHDLGIVVTHCARGQLNAVTHEVILERGDRKRIDLAALGLFEDLQAAVGHGERVVAEFKLAGLLADLVHREIDDPAELVALLIHMAGNRRAEHLSHNACGLLRLALLACRYADKAAGL